MKPPVFYRRFGYDLSLLPNAHLAKLDADVGSIEEARKKSGLTIGFPGWMLIYYSVLCSLDPEADNVLIETGTNEGCSSIILAQALKDAGVRGRVVTIEIDEAVSLRAQANFETAGVADRIDRRVGDAKFALRDAVAALDSIRVAYLDGCHLHDDVVAEFAQVEPKLAPGGVVIMDNTYAIAERSEDPRVHGALKTILARYGGNLINFPFVSWYTPGVAIWQRAPFPT